MQGCIRINGGEGKKLNPAPQDALHFRNVFIACTQHARKMDFGAKLGIDPGQINHVHGCFQADAMKLASSSCVPEAAAPVNGVVEASLREPPCR